MSTSFDSDNSHDPFESSFLSDAGPAVDDRRAVDRTSANLSVKLTRDGCTECHVCSASDISEDGLHVCIPSDSGLAVGERCEVIFGAGSDSPEFAALEGEALYATVVRTATLADGSTTHVGAGLRFDQRLYL